MTETTTCPDCAETIKVDARLCRFCGLRLYAKSAIAKSVDSHVASDAKPIPNFIIGLGALTVIGLIVTSYLHLDPDRQIAASSTKSEAAAHEYITRNFFDPSSSMFRNVTSSSICVTGQVNVKNRFGAYTGYKDFFYDVNRQQGAIGPDLDLSLMGTQLGLDQQSRRYAYDRAAAKCGQ